MNGSYSFAFTSPSAGRVVISWYARVNSRPILIAKGSHTFPAAATHKITVRLTRAGRHLLHEVQAIVMASFTDTHHRTTTVTRTIALRGA
jgi:hypothetical protein